MPEQLHLHHVGLFQKMRQYLPAMFGFEAVGVLLYDFEDDKFFTDSKDQPMNEPYEEITNTTDEDSPDDDEPSAETTIDIATPVPGQQREQSKRKLLSQKRSTLR